MDTESETKYADRQRLERAVLETDPEKLLLAIQRYLAGLVERSGISMEQQPSEFPRLEPDLEAALFRIVQEALANGF